MSQVSRELSLVERAAMAFGRLNERRDVKRLQYLFLSRIARLWIRESIGPRLYVDNIDPYLDWLVDMPWSRLTKDVLDIEKAKVDLEKNHYGLRKVKDRILEYLSVRKLNPDMKGPILCFVGPPGVGKTSLGHAIADHARQIFKLLPGEKAFLKFRGKKRFDVLTTAPGRPPVAGSRRSSRGVTTAASRATCTTSAREDGLPPPA